MFINNVVVTPIFDVGFGMSDFGNVAHSRNPTSQIRNRKRAASKPLRQPAFRCRMSGFQMSDL